MASNQDQSTPFKRFNSTLPLLQPPAPLHFSYCTKKTEQAGIGLTAREDKTRSKLLNLK